MASSFDKLDMSIMYPKGTEKALAWLGKYQWLKIVPEEGARIGLHINLPPIAGNIGKEYGTVRQLVGAAKRVGPTFLYSISKFFGYGPKLFRPTLEQCLAMCQVDINIPVEDYRQPFASILYQYPIEFCKQMALELGTKRFPSMALCTYDEKSGTIIVASVFAEGDTITAMIPPRNGRMIEDILVYKDPDHLGRKTEEDEKEFKLGELLQRIALNFSLMMTNHSVKTMPLNPEAWKKHREMAHDRKNAEKREKGQRLSASDLQVIEFEQNVVMYGTHGSDGPHEHTGLHVKPHWRRGHWRQQVHGPQNSLRKQVFIMPLMVNRKRFGGDDSDTTAVYRGNP